MGWVATGAAGTLFPYGSPESRMQTRHAILTLFALAVVGIGSLAFLGSKKKLPPRLEDAYGTVAALASSASDALATSHVTADGPDAGDAGPVIVRRTTQTA